MKRMIMAGLAAIAGAMLATASMAYDANVDVVMMGPQPDVGIYDLALVPDGADLLIASHVLVEADVVPDGLTAAAIASFQMASLTEPMATRGGVSDLMVDDAMRLWRSRTVDAFTVSPDLLI